MAIILGTSGVVLLITCTAFMGHEFMTFRQTAVQQLSTLGEIIATNSTAALAFDNQTDATEILAALKAERHIESACLYGPEKKIFAIYPSSASLASFPTNPDTDGYRFERGHLIGFAPVAELKGRRLGTLYINSDMGAMYERLRLYGEVALAVVAACCLVAYALSRKLQQQISRPILALAETAKAVSDRRDYAVRAEKLGEDELGLLTDAFNHMLGQIQEQNLALQQAYDNLRRTQQAVTQQERLGALGQMASGIAHDINNAISPASLYLESLLLKETNLSPRARDYLTTIQRAVDDVAETVSRLREFYRPRESQLVVASVDLNKMLDHVVDLTRVRWENISQQRGIVIEVRVDQASRLPAILGVESEIREALTNLIFNALDAMPEGGVLSLRTQFIKSVTDREDAAPPSVSVEVADTGVGMDEETKRRCLEPFFTTKGERGTGLGLAMVYGTLRRHNARIEIESELRRGTTMRLLFPLPEAELHVPTVAGTLPSTRPLLRILVVDDDHVLLRSLRETLEGEGHEVTPAQGGQEGIDLFLAEQAAGRPFAVVMTDLGMPKVDGREVVRAVKAASPTTPILLLTGWGMRITAEGDIPPGVDRVLNKPPKLRDLQDALSSLPSLRKE